MKARRLLAAMVIAVALAGCATVGDAVGTVVSSGGMIDPTRVASGVVDRRLRAQSWCRDCHAGCRRYESEDAQARCRVACIGREICRHGTGTKN